jgi:hypothetical protein
MNLLVEYCRLSATYDFSLFWPSGPLKCGPAGADKGYTIRELSRYACYWLDLWSKQSWHGCREV